MSYSAPPRQEAAHDVHIFDQEVVESPFDIKDWVGDLIAGLNKKSFDRQPRFMTLSALFPLRSVPPTASGRADRNTLQNVALTRLTGSIIGPLLH